MAAVTPRTGADADSASRFFESTDGWVQPLSYGTSQMSYETSSLLEVSPHIAVYDFPIAVDWYYREASFNNDVGNRSRRRRRFSISQLRFAAERL